MAHSLSSECNDRAVLLPITLLIDRQPLLARLLCRGDIVVLTLHADGSLRVERRDGSLDEAEVGSGTTAYVGLIILRLRAENGYHREETNRTLHSHCFHLC